MARFDKFMAEKNAVTEVNGHSATTKEDSSESPRPKQEETPPTSNDNHKRASDDDDLSEVPNSPSPKKKRKAEHFVDADAAFAAKLQAEENSRARPTRAGVNRKTTAIKKKRSPKKKTSDKIKAEDDSDLQESGSEAAEKKVIRSGGFHVVSFRPSYHCSANLDAETYDALSSPFRPFR